MCACDGRGGGDSYPEQSQAFKDEVGASPRSQQIKANCRQEGRKEGRKDGRTEGSETLTRDLEAGEQGREGLVLTPLGGKITSGGVL